MYFKKQIGSTKQIVKSLLQYWIITAWAITIHLATSYSTLTDAISSFSSSSRENI